MEMVYVLIRFYHPADKPYSDIWFSDSRWSPDAPPITPTGYTAQANRLAKALHDKFESSVKVIRDAVEVDATGATNVPVFELYFIDPLCTIPTSNNPEPPFFGQPSPPDKEIRQKDEVLLAESEKLGSMKELMKDDGGSFDLIFLKEIGERNKVPENDSDIQRLVSEIDELLKS